MITAVVMPQMGLEVTEGTVSAILVEPGAHVAKDDAVLELETDKATTDVVAPREGFVRGFAVAIGDTIPVGAVLLQLADTLEEPLDGGAQEDAPEKDAPASEPAPEPVLVGATVAPSNGIAPERLRAAPVARRAAIELGVVLERLTGTGPRGRITLRDVERAAEESKAPVQATPEVQAEDGIVIEQPSAMRRAIARRMTQSAAIPQYQLVRDVDATHLQAQRAALVAGAPEGAPRPGLNDLLIQAIAETALRHPLLASSWVEPAGERPHLARRTAIGVGLAVATAKGLLVPVIRDVPASGAAQIAAQRGALVAAARAGRLSGEQMAGGAITLSSLAGFGIDRFGAMVNPGESAIVAAGQIVERLVPRGRTIAIVPTLTLTVSFDHRVLDGAAGAEALATLAELLEGAMTWRP